MISLTVVLRPQRKFLAQRVKHPPGVVGFGDCLSHNHVRNPQPHLMSNTFLLIYDCQRFALRPLPPPFGSKTEMSVGPWISESQPPPSRARRTDKARSSPEPPPIVPKDPTRIGVGSQLVLATSRIEQSPNGTPPLSPVETENIMETLEKVRPAA